MKATFRIWRGDQKGGEFKDYPTEISEGMVVLDAVHKIQAEQSNDLACRWNCKAGKCGSCSADQRHAQADVHDPPERAPLEQPVTIEPMKAFPIIRDLVTDAAELRGQEDHQEIPAAQARRRRRHLAHATGRHRARAGIPQVHRVLHLPGRLPRVAQSQQNAEFIGPRFLTYTAALEMHPLDTADRIVDLKQEHGIGYCNIGKCCTKVCPEEITITDNAIIPLKERVVDQLYDPIRRLLRVFK